MTNDANKLLRQADRCKKLRTKAVQQIIIARDKGTEIVSIKLTVEELTDIAILCGNNETILRRRVREIKRDELSSTDAQPMKRCRMIPLEPDCRGYTDVFICTNCHQHIHLGFIRKEYSGSFCLECGAKVMDGDEE